jgi:hypothetical protein
LWNSVGCSYKNVRIIPTGTMVHSLNITRCRLAATEAGDLKTRLGNAHFESILIDEMYLIPVSQIQSLLLLFILLFGPGRQISLFTPANQRLNEDDRWIILDFLTHGT